MNGYDELKEANGYRVAKDERFGESGHSKQYFIELLRDLNRDIVKDINEKRPRGGEITALQLMSLLKSNPYYDDLNKAVAKKSELADGYLDATGDKYFNNIETLQTTVHLLYPNIKAFASCTNYEKFEETANQEYKEADRIFKIEKTENEIGNILDKLNKIKGIQLQSNSEMEEDFEEDLSQDLEASIE